MVHNSWNAGHFWGNDFLEDLSEKKDLSIRGFIMFAFSRKNCTVLCSIYLACEGDTLSFEKT